MLNILAVKQVQRTMLADYNKISNAIQNANAIIIGASNGLSISEGYNIFATGGFFQDHFSDFQKKYGIRSVLDGCFYKFKTEEEKWGFWSRLASLKCYTDPPTEIMQNLYKLVKNKDYFVITSNGEDHFVPAGFDENKVFEIEGKISQMRCDHKCSDEIYPNKDVVLELAAVEKNGVIPKEKIPKCPKCGGTMSINMADSHDFFTTKHWKNQQNAFQNFLSKYHNQNIVILELGVGWRNTMIKKPLMDLTASEPNAFYVTFNKGEVFIPPEIANKSVGINEDIGVALKEILKSGNNDL